MEARSVRADFASIREQRFGICENEYAIQKNEPNSKPQEVRSCALRGTIISAPKH
jgi:hypothetical protein